MGQTLSEPVVEKHSQSGEDERLVYGVSNMQGWRISNEDAHACILDLIAAASANPSTDVSENTNGSLGGVIPTTQTPLDQRISFFGVYDGHGGDKVAIYTGENLHEIVAHQEAFKKGDLEKALKDGFLAIDRAILSDPRYEDEVSGCTACVGLITKDKVYVGNSGDSRSVLGIKGRAKPLSFDHKPQNDSERARITAAGGFVDFGRVNGNLALSRAIGDFEFKKTAELPPEQQIVTAYPDVTIHEITEDDEFVVVACDGIWDCQSSQAVVEFVRRGIVAKQELSSICENLMDNCLARTSDTGGVGCDNMTVTIVALLNGKSKEEWYNQVAERVAKGDGPCAPPEFAEHRGPGVHHGEDNQEDYEVPMETAEVLHRLARNIILLPDGSGISTHTNHDGDTEMFDHIDEDEDLDSQVAEESTEGHESDNDQAKDTHKAAEPSKDTTTLPSKALGQENTKEEKSNTD